jgi:hypothetical protein
MPERSHQFRDRPGHRPEGLRAVVDRRPGTRTIGRVEGRPGNAREIASSDVHLPVSFAVYSKEPRHRRFLARVVDVDRPRTSQEQ